VRQNKVIFTVALLLYTSIATATIIRIPQDKWTIQDGIDIAVHEDTILVDEGIYKENINYHGKGIVIGSLFLITGDTTSITNTVIDGDLNGSVSTFENGEDSTSILIGITLTNGLYVKGGGIYCYESSPLLKSLILDENIANRGGGIYCEKSSPLIEHLLIRGNSTGGQNPFGGGLYCTDSSSPSLVDVTIINNSGGPGGGIYLTKSSNPDLVDVIISNNSGGMWGGGIYCESSNPRLKNVEISENRASFWGGGIYLLNSSPSIEDVTISRNVCGRGAGITCSSYSSPTLTNVKVIGNLASEHGGGIECVVNSNPKLINVIISENRANTNGGGIHCLNQIMPVLVNVTMSRNVAYGNGGGIYCTNSSPILINSVLWENKPHEIYFAEYSLNDSANSIMISHSNIRGGEEEIITNDKGIVYWLIGNINKKPLFVDAENGNFQLQENSPCIDAGTTFFVWEGDTLVDLPDATYESDAPDMGAFESPYSLVVDENVIIPIQYALYLPFPNPFNPITTIEFSIPRSGVVTLNIYDVLGRKVETILNEYKDIGHYNMQWNASNVPSGIYFIRMLHRSLSETSGDFSQVRKVMVVR